MADIAQQETYIISDLPIFMSGTWNDDKYTEKDLDDIVSSFNKIGTKLKPYLKLGHDGKQKLAQKDGWPAIGWVTGLKRKGKLLLATISNVPKKIKELIDKKAYGRISSEIFINLKDDDKIYKKALKAVALLGADTPAVTNLDDFINLYTENLECDKKQYTFNIKEFSMDQEIKTFEKEYAEAKLQIKEFEIEINNLKKETEDLKKEIESKDYALIEKDINVYLDNAIKVGKLQPAQREAYFNIAIDGKFDDVKAIFDSIEAKKEFAELSEVKEIEKPISDDLEQRTIDIDKKAKEYMLKHNLSDTADSYKQAVSIILEEVS